MFRPGMLFCAIVALVFICPSLVFNLREPLYATANPNTLEIMLFAEAVAVAAYVLLVRPRIERARQDPDYNSSLIYTAWPTLEWYALFYITFWVALPHFGLFRVYPQKYYIAIAVMVCLFVYIFWIRPILCLRKDIQEGLTLNQALDRRTIMLAIAVGTLIGFLMPEYYGWGIGLVAFAMLYRGIATTQNRRSAAGGGSGYDGDGNYKYASRYNKSSDEDYFDPDRRPDWMWDFPSSRIGKGSIGNLTSQDDYCYKNNNDYYYFF